MRTSFVLALAVSVLVGPLFAVRGSVLKAIGGSESDEKEVRYVRYREDGTPVSETPIKREGIEVWPDAKIVSTGKGGGCADLKVGMRLTLRVRGGYGRMTIQAIKGAEVKDEKKDPTEQVTLQYRVARDAFAPSRFVAVVHGGVTLPLDVTWELPKLEDKDKREAQEKRKKEFDDLIKKLEAGGINGVEFECKGEWLKKGVKLRITSVPAVTEAGKKTIKDNGG